MLPSSLGALGGCMIHPYNKRDHHLSDTFFIIGKNERIVNASLDKVFNTHVLYQPHDHPFKTTKIPKHHLSNRHNSCVLSIIKSCTQLTCNLICSKTSSSPGVPKCHLENNNSSVSNPLKPTKIDCHYSNYSRDW